MIKALTAVKKQIEDINEYEKKVGIDSTLPQFITTLENFNTLRQLQNNLLSTKTPTAKSTNNKKQAPVAAAAQPTESDAVLVNNFMEWLKVRGFDSTKCKVKIDRNTSEGTGLVATADIAEGEDFIELPDSLFITEVTAYNGLGKPEVLVADRLINQIPQLLLSIFLIKEQSNLSTSDWAPYIKLLPKSYNTIYYWTINEFNQFKGSPILDQAIRFTRGAMRQYCYLFSLFERFQNIIPLASFTWDSFVWAISTVQSRQNPVYTQDQTAMALIPFWDFCNHTGNGKITSFHHPEKNTMTSAAVKNYKKGDQVFMFYGPRDNTQFLLHAGFATKTNLNDSFQFSMHLLEGNSEIRHHKQHILEERGIRDGSIVRLSQNPSSDELPFELIPFYRIYALTEQETRAIAPPQTPETQHNHHGGALQIKPSAFEVISESNEEKAFSNLLQALKGRLSSYPTTLEEDEQEMKKNPSANQRYILYTKINEKKILDRNIKYIESLISKGVMNIKFKQPTFKPAEEEHVHGENCNHDHQEEGHGHSHAAGDHSHSH